MLCLLPLHGQTRGEDILSALLVFFEENPLSWSKLASVCTDGAPSMQDKERGLVGLSEKSAYYHCINVRAREAIIYQNSQGGEVRQREWCTEKECYLHSDHYLHTAQISR